jgi:hypothetical protein
MTPEDRESAERLLGGSYAEYLGEGWAGGQLSGLLAFVGLALAAGGVVAERRHGTADLTGSFPIPPAHWLLMRCGLVLILLVLLGVASAAVVTIGAIAIGTATPLGLVAASVVLAGLGHAYAVTFVLLASTWTRDTIGAALLGLALLYVLDGTASAGWQPGLLLDIRAWSPSPPWFAIAVAPGLTVSFLFLAIRRFATADRP